MISLLISLPFVDEVAPDDRVVRDRDGLGAAGDEAEGGGAGVRHLAPEALPAVDVARGADRDLAADRPAEVLGRAQRPLDPRRRDVDRVAVEVAAQEPGDALAEGVVDAARVVDEDGEALGPGQLDGEHLDVGQSLLHGLCDLSRQLLLPFVELRHSRLLLLARQVRSRTSLCGPSQKRAPAAPITTCEKCAALRIAADVSSS